MQLFYAATLLLSATLLFVVEPMFAKMVLRLLGGSSSVWNTCLVFYQAALLAGYVYAHVSVKWLGVRLQAAVHLALMCFPLLVLPIGVAEGWVPPHATNPVPWLLMLLTVSVGLPFVCISASAPLLQAWFAETGHRDAKDPYFLYAASNFGSMIALAAYPLVIESHWTLAEQSRWWAAGYGLLMALFGGCGLFLWVRRPEAARPNAAASEQDDGGAPSGIEDRPLTPLRRLRWVALAMVPSSLLLGVTAHMSTDIAAVPLLWVIPLMLYLLSFVLVFARRQILTQVWMLRVQAVLLAFLAGAFYLGGSSTSQVIMLAVLHLLAFFATSMVCHGQLAADRPQSTHLTEFYLWMSVGGVIGGLVNALVAPLVFKTVLEYPLMLVVACALRPWPSQKAPRWRQIVEISLVTLIAALLAVTAWTGVQGVKQVASLFSHVVAAMPAWTGEHGRVSLLSIKVGLVIVTGVAAFLLQTRPLRFAAALAMVMGISLICSGGDTTIYRERSFFGVLRVELDEDTDDNGEPCNVQHRLLHGSTLHGVQCMEPDEIAQPWTYYHRLGPVGDFFDELESRDGFLEHGRIGVVGLGTGTIAAYGQKKTQEFTYFEIDPAVERIARNPEYFTYLQDSKATVTVQLGDARLSLADAPDKKFDGLLIDAFSSDAIPLHLLNREALKLYFSKLADGGKPAKGGKPTRGGLLAIHISNRHLDLEPVLGNLAEDLGVVARVRDDVRDDADVPGKFASTWVVLARNEDDLGDLDKDMDWKPVQPDPSQRVWTDDFSNIVSVMDWDWLPGWEWLHRKPQQEATAD